MLQEMARGEDAAAGGARGGRCCRRCEGGRCCCRRCEGGLEHTTTQHLSGKATAEEMTHFSCFYSQSAAPE